MKEDDPLAWVEKAEEDWMTESDLETLSGYAITARYPSADPSKEDMQEALHIVKTIRKFSRSFLGLK